MVWDLCGWGALVSFHVDTPLPAHTAGTSWWHGQRCTRCTWSLHATLIKDRKLTRSWELFITNRSKTWNLQCCRAVLQPWWINLPLYSDPPSAYSITRHTWKRTMIFFSGHQSVNKMAVKRRRPFDGGANISNSNGHNTKLLVVKGKWPTKGKTVSYNCWHLF